MDEQTTARITELDDATQAAWLLARAARRMHELATEEECRALLQDPPAEPG